MVPLCGGSPSRGGTHGSTSFKIRILRRICHILVVVALVGHLDLLLPYAALCASGIGVRAVSAASPAVTEQALSTPNHSTASIEVAGGSIDGAPSGSAATEDAGSSLTFEAISYDDNCTAPLVIAGEIVRCDEGKKGPPYKVLSRRDSHQGPLLNQTFPVEVPPEWFHRRRMPDWQKSAEDGTSAGASSQVHLEERGGASSDVSPTTREKAGGLTDPRFIRIFGNWAAYSRTLNLWLERATTSALLRRLGGLAADQASAEELRPGGPVHATGAHSAPSSALPAAAFASSTHKHPSSYWQKSLFASLMEGSCIALIKLPADGQGTPSPSPLNSPVTAIPESCEDAQRMLLERASDDGAFQDVFWLVCGSELPLSRLNRYITFSISQEKLARVLDALDYSVYIWEEPHKAVPHLLDGAKGAPPSSEGGQESGGKEAAQQDVANGEEPSGRNSASPEALPSILAPHEVEARRLAAEGSERLACRAL
ncbi:hypothetical protein cyc_03668 [Cyclospora cayetanensis]|uniref:Uncharacterized protein n=1 Tax=Cyclospora cayetanensis TaxID=88456 RepID=A0A1D3D9X6_9EIME|nr:hypothetical protein cyc_03668 [Cyclospora cayetanensis]